MTPPTKAELEALMDDLESAHVTLDRMITDFDDPPSPSPQPTVKYAQHQYDNSVPVDLSNGCTFYDTQRGGSFANASPFRFGREVYIYATIVKCVGDPNGFRQFMKPAAVKDGWLARTASGSLISRGSGDNRDLLIDIINPLWQDAAVANIVNEAVIGNVHGVYVDEVDWTNIYPWPLLKVGNKVKTMPYDADWQRAWLTFLTKLSQALAEHALKLWINLGANYDINDSWQSQLVNVVHGVNIEFFVGREGVGQPPTNVNDAWLQQGEFVAAVENRGKAAHVHCSSNTPDVINYAFLSWLMFTQFNGSFSAGLTYGGRAVFPDSALASLADLLGSPTTGVMGTVSTGYARSFQHGTVFVNPWSLVRNGMPALSGRITLNS
jgi:hypothetical protein